MRRLIFQTIIGITLFGGGIAVGAVWNARRVRRTPPAASLPAAQRPEEKPWPLTQQVVARSLQSRSFRTDKLRINSNDDIVWRWLKEAIANYPQNWVKLDISKQHSYGVALDPPRVLEPTELVSCNHQLAINGLAPLTAGKLYNPVRIKIDDIECPDWQGLIDADQAKLVWFEGISG